MSNLKHEIADCQYVIPHNNALLMNRYLALSYICMTKQNNTVVIITFHLNVKDECFQFQRQNFNVIFYLFESKTKA